MDGKTFAKMAKDTKILDKALTATDIDLVFAKVKAKTARKITLAQFQKGIEECATKKRTTFEALSEKICSVGGPVYTGTKADAVKYHDDKSLYTGVYANGGPTNVDAGNGMISDIS
jgi:peptide methionine sulfoxide reductase MsrB